jgi:hypothetical protein
MKIQTNPIGSQRTRSHRCKDFLVALSSFVPADRRHRLTGAPWFTGTTSQISKPEPGPSQYTASAHGRSLLRLNQGLATDPALEGIEGRIGT